MGERSRGPVPVEEGACTAVNEGGGGGTKVFRASGLVGADPRIKGEAGGWGISPKELTEETDKGEGREGFAGCFSPGGDNAEDDALRLGQSLIDSCLRKQSSRYSLSIKVINALSADNWGWSGR